MSRKRKRKSKPAKSKAGVPETEILAEGSGPVQAVADDLEARQARALEAHDEADPASEGELAADASSEPAASEVADADALEEAAPETPDTLEAAPVEGDDVERSGEGEPGDELEAVADPDPDEAALEAGADGVLADEPIGDEPAADGDAIAAEGAAEAAAEAAAEGGPEGEMLAEEAEGEVPGATLPTSAMSLDGPQLKLLVEALVFASDKPMTVLRLRQLTRIADTRRLEAALVELQEDYKERGIILQQVSGGWQFRTRTQWAGWVQQLIAGRPVRLTRAQLETLAIIAYRQPITRPEIDEIRGVDSSATLKLLMDRQLIRTLGKKEEVGRPMLYGTTKEFLDFFSLGDLRELPTLREYSELTDESRRVIDDRLGPAEDSEVSASSDDGGDDEGGSGSGSGSGSGEGGEGGGGGGEVPHEVAGSDETSDASETLEAASTEEVGLDDVFPDGGVRGDDDLEVVAVSEDASVEASAEDVSAESLEASGEESPAESLVSGEESLEVSAESLEASGEESPEVSAESLETSGELEAASAESLETSGELEAASAESLEASGEEVADTEALASGEESPEEVFAVSLDGASAEALEPSGEESLEAAAEDARAESVEPEEPVDAFAVTALSEETADEVVARELLWPEGSGGIGVAPMSPRELDNEPAIDPSFTPDVLEAADPSLDHVDPPE